MNADGTLRFKISEQQYNRLQKEVKASGIGQSEIIRRAIDEYVKNQQQHRIKLKEVE